MSNALDDMIDSMIDTMQVKFFPRDVIGKQPTKVGDTFEAEFFGSVVTMRVESYHGDCFMAVQVNG